MTATIEIAGRKIGPDHPPYVICELSANHNGDLDRALEMIDHAADTGCDAIKIQTYTADTLTIDVDRPEFRIEGGLWDGRTLHDLYSEAQTPFEWHGAMFERAAKRGVTLFSTPFDPTAVDLLSGLDAPAYKVASFELLDLPLIARIAREGKPMIMSTGIANLGEIEAAVRTARENGCEELVLLHCISSYPAPAEDSNLRTIPHLAEAFSVVAGLSDHTLGTATSVASVALGARVIEKHFTLDRNDGGPDSSFSLEPQEFRDLVRSCNDAFLSLGQVGYALKPSEQGVAKFRRSLYVVADVDAGETLTESHVRSIRPGYGLPPKALPDVLGRRARRDLKRGDALDWTMIE
ncbi:pseudaminic acid synthase [Oceanomicrobium pacificus]|uniref:Pseudaminic acid synthase n=1 Tax=Oceanomicrobium pacificus TaxID=2692916 RepID=A0A6B0TPR3_9RHOB|nr:pseudaminic acid synthase [Oceanomicrobium pacificus]MXU66607.1 pseudaminic acid synthase [Oceanomicrobium pacificus]